MYMKYLTTILFLVVVFIGGVYWYLSSPVEQVTDNDNGTYRDLIRVDSPQTNEVISSPLTISGAARGMWYFEATFSLRLLDANGNEVPIQPGYIMTENEWMTEDFVPFETTHTFTAPETETGTLVFERANPSGLPEHADEYRVPVRFDTGGAPLRTIQLYYYDPGADEDESGNIMCSEAGLVAVDRSIPVTQTPVQDAVQLLLRGEVTPQERMRGITTEYPLEGLELTGASRDEGALVLQFADPEGRTVGGSCRTNILWLQIRETAKQFEGVDEVQFQPETLFQP
jgi:hypothetical protein